MAVLSRILCPLDFSAFSRRALDHALALAARSGGKIRALHVLPPASFAPGRSGASVAPELGPAPDRLALLEDLEALVEAARPHEVGVECVVAAGKVPAAILEEAQSWPADLLVMGTRGFRARSGWAVGSVTETVLFRSPCPVLAVPLPKAGNGGAPSYSSILCPIDFSEPCQQALEYAAAFAQQTAARLTLLHIVEWFPAESELAFPLRIPELHLDLTEEAGERMRRALPADVLGRVDHEEIVVTGLPHHAILRTCRERSVDLIVLGVHARREIDKALAGATVSHVLREAICPILAVCSREEVSHA
jgi:nucleotide-binding universal stress UspA family protein